MKKARWLIVVSIVAALTDLGSILPRALESTGSSQILDVRHLSVARDEAGSIWAVWEADTGDDTDLYFSHWQAGAWSQVQTVYHHPGAWDRAPSVAITPDGTVWLAWTATERADPNRARLYTSRWMATRWTEPRVAPTSPGIEDTQPALAAAPDGGLWLAWVGLNGVDRAIFASRWDGRAWSPAAQVSADDRAAGLYDAQPRLAVGPDSRPWIVWTGHQAGVDDEIYYSHWNGAHWTPEGLVSKDDDGLDVDPSLVMDGEGQPWAAWKGRVKYDDGSHSRARIWVSRWDAATSSWLPEEVASSPLSREVEEEQPVLFRDGDGGMHLAWVVEGAADRALAHSRWQDGAWQEASLLREDLDAEEVAVVAPAGGKPGILWLSPADGSPQPPITALVGDSALTLATWTAEQPRLPRAQQVDPIPNRTLAFGDSITCTPICWQVASRAGIAQDEEPYPARLERKLDLRVAQSEVINAGKSGEATYGGSERITGQVSTHQPKYVLILEGTNDVTRDKLPSDVRANLETMIDNARQVAGVAGVEVMLATIIPRSDGLNDQTAQMNSLAVLPAAQSRGVPVCDQWTAWMSLPYWANLLVDDGKHPNEAGRMLIADTFYACMLAFFPDVSEETVPPEAWIESIPATVECGQPVTLPVTWDGVDNLSWVVDYDVQLRFNDGAWTDWLMGTPHNGGTYYASDDNTYQDRFYFQVRARDLLGNVGAYSDPAYAEVVDSVPPTEAHVNPLPPVVLAPFEVSWWGADACSGVTAYGVQYRTETQIEWQTWLSPTLSQGADLAPASPAYGETYEFRVRPRDAAGNWGAWSAVETSTVLAQWQLQGQVLNVRREPVAATTIHLDPAALQVVHQTGGRFLAYLATSDSYDVSAARSDLYGSLPAMHDVPVTADVSGLSFILPPLDDAVAGGGFEAGDLRAWQLGGTLPPTLTVAAHTGLGAVRLGGAGENAYLSQWVTPAGGDMPTLSFLVRLDQPGAASTLQVQMANSDALSPPLVYTLTIDGEAWTHVWYDLGGLVSEPLTLTFHVSDTVAILLDEISLGSARQGLFPVYLPILTRN